MITDDEFQRIVKYMKRKAGINLSAKRILIQGRLDNYLQKNGYESYSQFLDVVENCPMGIEAEYMLNALTTNHTYFWREHEQFLYLKEHVFPQMARWEADSRDWHIWCAASSTGEEPYTLAMLCTDYLGLDYPNWDTQVLATDIDTHVLDIARKGIYTKDSVEHLPHTYVRRFFRNYSDKEYQVTKELKEQVLFRQFNLMNPLPFSRPLHVVFLRNVMIYFEEETKLRLLNQIYDKLMPGGYLFIGSTESINQNHGKFEYIKPSVYRKPLY